MHIKKFVAATLKEATDQMRSELGPNAIILNTRRVRSDKGLSFFGKEMLEITAAIDDMPLQKKPDTAEGVKHLPHPFQKAREAYGIPSSARSEAKKEFVSTLAERETQPLVSKEAQQSAELLLLRNEVEEMRHVVLQIADHLKYTKMPVLPVQLQKLYLRLVNNDVDEKIAADIVQRVYGNLTTQQYDDRRIVEQSALAEITKYIATKPLPTEQQKSAYVVALVGPTGVGKTTTIAKLAAIHKLVHHQNVALITADTYRIGAIEQLKTFASIAEIPMQVVYQPSEMRTAMKAFRKKDIVFIDTVGRSQRAKKELTELKKFIDAAEPDEVHLVLNASAGRKVLLDIVDRFKVLRPTRYLLSKIDEALFLGGLLSVFEHYKMPVSYITNGQVVPDDLLVAEPTQVAAMISGANAYA